MGQEGAPDLQHDAKMLQVATNFGKHQEGLEPEAARAGRRGERAEQGRHRQASSSHLIVIHFILDVGNYEEILEPASRNSPAMGGIMQT